MSCQNFGAGKKSTEQSGGKEKNFHLSRDRPGQYIYPRMTSKQLVEAVRNLSEGTMMEVHFND